MSGARGSPANGRALPPSPPPKAARSQVKLHPSIVQPVTVLGALVTTASMAQRWRSSDGQTREGRGQPPHNNAITVACPGLWHLALYGNHPGTCWQLPSGWERGKAPRVLYSAELRGPTGRHMCGSSPLAWRLLYFRGTCQGWWL